MTTQDLDLYVPTALRNPIQKAVARRWAIGVETVTGQDVSVGMLAGPYETEQEALEHVGAPGHSIYSLDGVDDHKAWSWDELANGWRRIPSTTSVDHTDRNSSPFVDDIPESQSALSTTVQPTFSGDQQRAWDKIQKWVESPRQKFFVLKGFAGTGKTFMLRQLRKHYQNTIFTAPTNKAAKVLGASVGLVAKTTYSALGLRMEQQEDELVLVSSERLPYYPPGTILVIDEASMVNKQLHARLEELCEQLGIRVIYVGDPAQLPPVGELRSPAWRLDIGDECRAMLKEVMRFDNQLLRLATSLRSCIKTRNWNSPVVDDHNDVEGIWTYSRQTRWLREWTREVKTPDDCRQTKALAWRNKTVNALNQHMREHLGFTDVYCVGDIMLLGAPVEQDGSIVAHTDDEFVITGVQKRVIHALDQEVRVWTLNARQTDDDWAMSLNIPVNRVLVDDLLGRLARKARGRTGSDRKSAWRDFWDVHRLFHDVRYGYAMTVHRAQGSTYTKVMVDQSDILANRNSREAFRCLYVAATRPTTQLHVL